MNSLYNSLIKLNIYTHNKYQICSYLSKVYSTSPSANEEKIIIPKRIHRGPTDILNALSSTVGQDSTAPHYKFHDDPFLIPMSNLGKRTFAMAQESGRKAAKWIRQENSKLFQVSQISILLNYHRIIFLFFNFSIW